MSCVRFQVSRLLVRLRLDIDVSVGPRESAIVMFDNSLLTLTSRIAKRHGDDHCAEQ